MPPLAEALTYVGMALVVAGASVVAVRLWHDLAVGGRLAVGMAVVLLGFGAARVVARGGDPPSLRVASALQTGGTGGVAIVAGVLATAFGSHDAGVTALAVGPALAATGAVLWRNGDRPLPFLSTVAGVVVTAVAVHDVAGLDLTPAEAGAVAWAAGAGLACAALLHLVRPAAISAVLGLVAALGGALAISDAHAAVGGAVGMATAAGAVLVGLARRLPVLAGLGMVGFLIFLGRVLAQYVRGPAAALAVVVLGVVLVAAGLGRWSRGAGPPGGPDAGGPADGGEHHASSGRR